ncbi:MAG: response regulator [Desulfobacterales bacterium]|nr:response regulator [Desulfobacterales bacterium]
MAKASEKTVFVVDDEPDVRNFLSTFLQDAGFRVETASDGQDALDRIGSVSPDLMTLDMVMPGKSGIELIRCLRQDPRWAGLPVVVITAHAANEFASEDIRCLNAFTSGLKPRRTIKKPVTPEILVETICDILGVTVDPVTVPEVPSPATREEEKLLKLIRESNPGMISQIKAMLDR